MTRSAAGPFRSLLIVKLSALGDVAHALPVADYLRKAAPGAAVDWAVDRRFASLLEGHPALRRVVALDIRAWKSRWSASDARREAAGAVRSLREGKYDAAFDIQGNAKSGVVTWLSGARLRYGFDRDGVREAPNLLFTNRKVPSDAGDRHITEKLLRVVGAPFGGPFSPQEPQAVIALSPGETRRAESIVTEAAPGAFPRLVVHPGTTWGTKKMDPGFWAAVLRLLRDSHPRMGAFLSWGTEEERAEAETVRGLAGGGVSLLPRLTLKEFAAVCRRCGFLMAPDTGPLHVAAAAGARTVSVFRATDGRRNAPRGPGHRFLQAPLPCGACLRKRCARDAECRAAVAPETAAAAMRDLMEAFA